MPVKLVWDGLYELKEALTRLPEELRQEATWIVLGAAEEARQEIYTRYPVRTGNLRNALYLKPTKGEKGLAVGAYVRNNAPHAWLFEHGTQARHSKLGATWGPMPAANLFDPVVERQRGVMFDGLRDLLRRHGLSVTG